MAAPSLMLRVTRALVGLATVWCLGCSGYESILSSLLGEQAVPGMTCTGESGTRSAVQAPPSADDAGITGATVGSAGESRDFDCGCGGSCHAPSLSVTVAATPRAAVPAAPQHAPTAPDSVARVPLLPPPELAV